MNIQQIGARDENDRTIYAGIARGLNGEPDYRLLLLDAKPDRDLTWTDAVSWAEEHGALLPTRKEQALLYANLGEEFNATWYWSGEQYAGNGDAAWFQYFGNGGQDSLHKLNKLRVRAVRRLPVE